MKAKDDLEWDGEDRPDFNELKNKCKEGLGKAKSSFSKNLVGLKRWLPEHPG